MGGDFWWPPFSPCSHEFLSHIQNSKIPHYDVIWTQFNYEKVVKTNESRRKTMITKINKKKSKLPYYDVIWTPFDHENNEKSHQNSWEQAENGGHQKSPPPRLFSLGDPINLLYDLIEVKKNSALYILTYINKKPYIQTYTYFHKIYTCTQTFTSTYLHIYTYTNIYIETYTHIIEA